MFFFVSDFSFPFAVGVIGSSICSPCPVGSYQLFNGSSTCQQCQKGKSQPFTGQSGKTNNKNNIQMWNST